MATITSNGTGGGLASIAASWAGGIVPVLADDVVISAGDTIELDGAIAWNSMQAFGILKASRAMSSSLTIYANISYTVPTGGKIDFGTAASPIPAAYLAEWIMDSPTAGGVTYKIQDGGEFTSYGAAARTRCSELTAQALIAQNIINVDDATGWLVGDRMCFESAAGGGNRIYEFATSIAAISGLQITLVDNLTTQMETGWLVGNTEANVIVRSNDLTEADQSKNPVLNIYRSSFISNDLFHATNTSFRGLGKASAWLKWGLQFFGGQWVLTTYADLSIAPSFTGCSVVNVGGGIWGQYSGFNLTNHLTCLSGITPSSPWDDHGTIIGGPNRVTCNGVYAFNLNVAITGTGIISNLKAVNCKYCAHGAGPEITSGLVRKTSYMRIGIGGTVALRNVTLEQIGAYIGLSSATATLNLYDCTQIDEPGSYIVAGGGGQDAYDYTVAIINKNGDPTGQYIYTLRGDMQRDNVVFKSGSSSQKFSATSAVNALSKSWLVIAANATPVSVTGFLRSDAAFNGTVVLKLSGMGITPVLWTHTFAAADAWELFSLSATQSVGADGVFDLSMAVTGTAGSVWIDQIAAPPAVAVNTGDMGFYDKGSAIPALLANFVTPVDVRNEFDANSTQMKFMTDFEGGKWEISGSQMIYFEPDNATEVARFDLYDAAGGLTSDIAKVVKRVRV